MIASINANVKSFKEEANIAFNYDFDLYTNENFIVGIQTLLPADDNDGDLLETANNINNDNLLTLDQ